MEQIDVSVVAVTRGSRVLMMFNRSWGSFTLPMTKRRLFVDPNLPSGRPEEAWNEAAARAAAEALGQTIPLNQLELLADIPEYRQGDRNGEWKRYHFQIFRFALPEEATVKGGLPIEWLTIKELLDPNRAPISPTARDLIPQALEVAAQAGKPLQ